MKRCISKWSISKYFLLHVSNIFCIVHMYEQERWFLFRYETIFSVVVAHGKTVYRFSTCVDIYMCSYVRACVRVWVCCTFFRSMHPGSRNFLNSFHVGVERKISRRTLLHLWFCCFASWFSSYESHHNRHQQFRVQSTACHIILVAHNRQLR